MFGVYSYPQLQAYCCDERAVTVLKRPSIDRSSSVVMSFVAVKEKRGKISLNISVLPYIYCHHDIIRKNEEIFRYRHGFLRAFAYYYYYIIIYRGILHNIITCRTLVYRYYYCTLQ